MGYLRSGMCVLVMGVAVAVSGDGALAQSRTDARGGEPATRPSRRAETRAAAARRAATQPAATVAPAVPATLPSSDEVMREMSREIESRPLIESGQPEDATPAAVVGQSPTQPADAQRAVSAAAAGTAGVGEVLDPAMVGQAPGGKRPKLRREGEFVVNRLGRVLRTAGGGSSMFVFDADAKEAPDPPVVLLPSTALQSMEDQMRERGDRVRFEVSGQITTYRAANYLMVTRWAVPPDRGNLQR